MKFSTIFASLAFSMLPSVTHATTVAFDTVYDNGGTSLTAVACSDGANGLITRGFTTFDSLPHFPHIGAASAVTGFNSPNCGTCWELSFTDSSGVTRTVNIIAIDVAGEGFTISLSAMNELTNGNGVQFGRIDAATRQVAASVCGL